MGQPFCKATVAYFGALLEFLFFFFCLVSASSRMLYHSNLHTHLSFLSYCFLHIFFSLFLYLSAALFGNWFAKLKAKCKRGTNKNITTWKWDADQFSICPKTMHFPSLLSRIYTVLPTPPVLLSFPIKVVVVRRYWKQLNAQISCPLFSSMCERRKSRKRRRSSSSRGRRRSRRREGEATRAVETQNIQKTFYSCLVPKTQAGIQMRSKCRGRGQLQGM